VDGEPFFVDRGQAARIWDVDGNEYIDYVGSWGPAILGHAPKVVVEAVRDAATRGLSFGIPNPLEAEMAELICDWVPSIEKVRMVNSGTEAAMSCIRLARAFTRRDKIVKFDGCYHGHADALLVKAGSGALTHGQPSSAGVPSAFADLTISLPFNNAELLREVFQENKNEIAAVIIEPIPANTGLYFPRENFLSVLREECTSNHALLIFDEVITGFRVARGGAQELYGVKPDLTALGKIIGGGLPVGAFGGRAEIMDALQWGGVLHYGTHNGSRIGMFAARANLRVLTRDNNASFRHTWKISEKLCSGLRQLLQKKGRAAIVQNVGPMLQIMFTDRPAIRDYRDFCQYVDRAAFQKFVLSLFPFGVYASPSAALHSIVTLAHSEEDVELTLEAASKALDAAA